ncbi:hypothetical protein DMENIID0001_071890 [Sergentomyia squamirostris]
MIIVCLNWKLCADETFNHFEGAVAASVNVASTDGFTLCTQKVNGSFCERRHRKWCCENRAKEHKIQLKIIPGVCNNRQLFVVASCATVTIQQRF